MRAIIVDDEKLAREELARLIKDVPGVSLVGEASNGMEALLIVSQEQPDLVFLDVEMPGMSGFEFLEKLPAPHPAIIFTTAYEEFALKAFRVDAIDYLLKPIDPDLLAKAVSKMEQFSPHAGSRRPASASDGSHLKPEDRVFVRDGTRCWFIKVGSIRLLESEGNYTRLHIGNDKPLVHGALKAFQARLDPTVFFRVNRTQIVNLANVERVALGLNEELVAHLSDGMQVTMSRRMAQAFREQWGF